MFSIKVALLACGIAVTLAKPEPKPAKEERANLFILSDREVPNAAAFLMCDALGGMVPVSIEDAAKNLEVTRFMSSYDISSAWTSGDDLEIRNNYIWRGTSNPFVYTNWLIEAPLADESCRCVAFVSGIHESCGSQNKCAGWTVEPCSLPRRVICELPPLACDKKADETKKVE